jgi:ankyrin repeat protein
MHVDLLRQLLFLNHLKKITLVNNPSTTIHHNLLFASILNDSYEVFVKNLFNYSSLINEKNNKGETLLHFACFFGMIDKYYALINVGAIPSLTKEGNNLLHYASFSGKDNYLIVELVKSGISPIEKNLQGQTSLHFCANEQISHYLNLWCIRNKIKIEDLKDNDNNNIAHGCKMAGHETAALYWIKHYPKLSFDQNDYKKLWNEIKKKYYQYCMENNYFKFN